MSISEYHSLMKIVQTIQQAFKDNVYGKNFTDIDKDDQSVMSDEENTIFNRIARDYMNQELVTNTQVTWIKNKIACAFGIIGVSGGLTNNTNFDDVSLPDIVRTIEYAARDTLNGSKLVIPYYMWDPAPAVREGYVVGSNNKISFFVVRYIQPIKHVVIHPAMIICLDPEEFSSIRAVKINHVFRGGRKNYDEIIYFQNNMKSIIFTTEKYIFHFELTKPERDEDTYTVPAGTVTRGGK